MSPESTETDQTSETRKKHNILENSRLFWDQPTAIGRDRDIDAYKQLWQGILGLRANTGVSSGDDDADAESFVAVAESFVAHLMDGREVLEKLAPEEAAKLGVQAAERVLASARWSQVVGDRLDTSQVKQLLGVSRQALAKRQRSGSLLGLAGDGTTWYPTWQFDLDQGSVRPEVLDVIVAFRERLDEVDPLMVASWATTSLDEDLAGETPAQWLSGGRDREQLRRAAQHAAARLTR